MKLARRGFLKALGLAVGAIATGQAFRAPAAAAELDLAALAAAGIARAKQLGCCYADVRIDRTRDADGVLRERCAVRVVHEGVWGRATSPSASAAEVARSTERALANARGHVANDAEAPLPASKLLSSEMYFSSSKGGHSRTLRSFE
jgi:hypothetical protein